MRARTQANVEFSMSQLADDFASFAPYSPDNVVPGGGAMGGKNYVQGAAKQAEKAAGGITDTIKKAAGSVQNQAVAAKNRVAVLVKGANGKVFVQQRLKNVQDAGKIASGVAKQAGGMIKSNPGKAGLVVAGAGAIGYVGKNLLDADKANVQKRAR